MIKTAVLKWTSQDGEGPRPRPRRRRDRAQAAFLQTFAAGRLNYWVSFCSDSAAALFFLFWSFHARTVPWLFIAPLFVAGLAVWTFSEYVFHRWVYHQARGIFGSGHRMHHDAEKAYIAMPWFISSVTIFLVWYGVVFGLKMRGFSALLAGWMTGFVLYSWVHHVHHHASLHNRWMRGLRAYHRVHHRFPETNFGVTTRIWDRVFRTEFKARGSDSSSP